jgi:hypothetical protein
MSLPSDEYQTAQRQTLDEILDWRQGVNEALTDQRASVQRAIRELLSTPARFMAMTEAEVDDYFDYQRRELDRLTIVNLVASAEATIVTDYFRRVRGKRKDPLARAYRAWHGTLSSKKKRRPDFDEAGILEILKKTRAVESGIIGQYRECLRARHWLGHGRRRNKPAGMDRFDPDDVYRRSNALLNAIPE